MATKSMNLDFDQLKALSLDQVRAKIVEHKADWHPTEKKIDLIGRLVQLQGTAQPIDKIKKELANNGVGGDEAATDTVQKQSKRLTKAQIDKALAKFVAKGLEYRVSKDGTQWMMRFKTTQPLATGKIVNAVRRDSGNTMMPLSVLVNAASSLTTVSKVTPKKTADDDFGPDFPADDHDHEADEAAA